MITPTSKGPQSAGKTNFSTVAKKRGQSEGLQKITSSKIEEGIQIDKSISKAFELIQEAEMIQKSGAKDDHDRTQSQKSSLSSNDSLVIHQKQLKEQYIIRNSLALSKIMIKDEGIDGLENTPPKKHKYSNRVSSEKKAKVFDSVSAKKSPNQNGT